MLISICITCVVLAATVLVCISQWYNISAYILDSLARNIHFQMSKWRLQAAKRPKRIILIRHGESQGNIDKYIYERVPDNKIELTEHGVEQVLAAGKELKKIIGNETVLFLVSPFIRSQQSYQAIARAFVDNDVRVRYDPRLREQEFGNWQNVTTMQRVLAEREVCGRFYYRFQDGESGADVFDRVSSFMESLFREVDTQTPVQNIIIVSHGLFIRLFLMRFFRWTVERFHSIWNMNNAEWIMLEKHPLSGSYELKTALRMNKNPPHKAAKRVHQIKDEQGIVVDEVELVTPDEPVSLAALYSHTTTSEAAIAEQQAEQQLSSSSSAADTVSPPESLQGSTIDQIEQVEQMRDAIQASHENDAVAQATAAATAQQHSPHDTSLPAMQPTLSPSSSQSNNGDFIVLPSPALPLAPTAATTVAFPSSPVLTGMQQLSQPVSPQRHSAQQPAATPTKRSSHPLQLSRAQEQVILRSQAFHDTAAAAAAAATSQGRAHTFPIAATTAAHDAAAVSHSRTQSHTHTAASSRDTTAPNTPRAYQGQSSAPPVAFHAVVHTVVASAHNSPLLRSISANVDAEPRRWIPSPRPYESAYDSSFAIEPSPLELPKAAKASHSLAAPIKMAASALAGVVTHRHRANSQEDGSAHSNTATAVNDADTDSSSPQLKHRVVAHDDDTSTSAPTGNENDDEDAFASPCDTPQTRNRTVLSRVPSSHGGKDD